MNSAAGLIRYSLIAGLLLLVFPTSSLACVTAGGPPTPASRLYREFPNVFIARVVEIRPTPVITGTVNGVSVGIPASEVRLSVVQALKGTAATEFIVARGGTSCDPQFFVDGSYLVFAMNPEAGSSRFSFTRFASFPLPEVTQALKYIEAVRSNQPQAFLYGVVTRHSNGNLGSQWWREQFTVQAEGNGAVFETQTTADYHLSLPPGNYTVRLLRKGQPASEAQTVRLESGDETLRSFDSIPAPR
jgi:hypothetical protein